MSTQSCQDDTGALMESDLPDMNAAPDALLSSQLASAGASGSSPSGGDAVNASSVLSFKSLWHLLSMIFSLKFGKTLLSMS